MIRFLLTFVLLVATAGAVAAQQSEEDPLVRCARCQSTGHRPCGEHDKRDCQLEGNAIYCSEIGLCAACGGTGWVDCERCDNPVVEQRDAQRRERIPDVAAEYAYFEEELRRPIPLVVTEHFALVFDLERAKVGRKVLDRHELLHLYADRLEKLYRDYVTLLGVEEREFERRSRVLVWSNEPDHREGAQRYCTMAFRNGTRLLGMHPTYSVPALKEFFRDDEALHRNLVHNATHLLLSHQEPTHWMGQTKGGWADAGLAHYFEDRYFGICDNYCYTEADLNQDFEGGRWRPAVRALVAADEVGSFAALFQQNTDTLSLSQHAVAFGLIDYLAQLDGEKLDAMLKLLRQKVATRDALKQAFDTTPLALEERWKAWVLETYPKR